MDLSSLWVYPIRIRHLSKSLVWRFTGHGIVNVYRRIFQVENPDEGIHIDLTGGAQSGKSDAVRKALKNLP